MAIPHAKLSCALECEPEQDEDLSWVEDDQETLDNLESGLWTNYTFKVAVYDAHGRDLAADYLGNSIYANPLEFRDHRACGRANREHAAAGQPGRCGSYFKDMVRNVIHDARVEWNEPRVRLRNV